MVDPGSLSADAIVDGAVVTQWGADMVAAVARRVGWKGAPLVDATALAMAASGGADHYSHNPISAPGAERRGLWAIRVDEVPGDSAVDLFDVDANALVARALWELSSQTFAWHPAWVSGTAARIRPSIELHLSKQGKRSGPLSGQDFQTRLHGMAALAEHIAQASEPGRVPGV